MRNAILAACVAAVTGLAATATLAAEGVHIPKENWSFGGLFGTFDRGALQRGFEVYNGICSTCHSLKLLAYRNLEDIGYTEDQVKKIAASKQVTDGPNDQGEMFQRPGKPSDHFVKPFPNDQAAQAANNGALPPDLSLIIKAREGGANYVHAILTGFKQPPPGVKVPDGMYYNVYFPGQQIAMPPPLSDGAIEYSDKTKATVDQMARDVATFLTWASEPKLETRKRTGVKVVLFLIVLTGMLYAVKRKVWSDVH